MEQKILFRTQNLLIQINVIRMRCLLHFTLLFQWPQNFVMRGKTFVVLMCMYLRFSNDMVSCLFQHHVTWIVTMFIRYKMNVLVSVSLSLCVCLWSGDGVNARVIRFSNWTCQMPAYPNKIKFWIRYYSIRFIRGQIVRHSSCVPPSFFCVHVRFYVWIILNAYCFWSGK